MSMRLAELLGDVVSVDSRLDREIGGLTLDSKSITPGAAFVALRGSRHHGIEFAADAVARGAAIVIAEAPIPDIAQLDVPVLVIDELRARLGEIALRYFACEAATTRLIGVTGTNGKTSTVQMIAQALTLAGECSGTIGTLGTGLYGELAAGERTTPDIFAVHRAIAAMRTSGARTIAMEVTSHALDQGRVDALDFEIAVFTNLTRDHLDYHGSMDAYAASKAKLFQRPRLRTAVINCDDAYGMALANAMVDGVHVLRTSIASNEADIYAADIHADARGLRFTLWVGAAAHAVQTRLIGRFNVANLLGVVGVLHALGWDAARIAGMLSQLDPVPGRMSRLGGNGLAPLVIIDYAHTPDALEKALSTLREHAHARLIVVFGCGGERDAGKRPQMAAIAEQLADVVIVTDDNPRHEDGDRIVADIRSGFADANVVRFERDRRTAIGVAIALAAVDDVVLIAGKGHEPHQEVAGQKLPFDDLQVAAGVLKEAA